MSNSYKREKSFSYEEDRKEYRLNKNSDKKVSNNRLKQRYENVYDDTDDGLYDDYDFESR